jgi:hypothetical protein
MDKYFSIKSTITFPNSKSVRKDGIITKPIRIYILGESVLKFCDKIGFEGDKQKSLKALIPKLK